MNIQDLITLHNAGYTKEDIFKILGNEQKPEQQPEQQPEQPEQKPEQKPEQQPEQPVSDDRIKQLETKLDYVINRFNYLVVQQSSQPNNGETESVDDILASVVRGIKKDD